MKGERKRHIKTDRNKDRDRDREKRNTQGDKDIQTGTKRVLVSSQFSVYSLGPQVSSHCPLFPGLQQNS